MDEEEKNEHEELDIKDLAQSSLEDENKSMADLDEFKLPEIDFESTDVELEDQAHEEEMEEEESISVRSEREEESEEEVPDMSPMESEEILQDEDQPDITPEHPELDETQEQEISLADNDETDQEMPDMSPMSEMLVQEEEVPETDFSVDEAKIDFQSTEQNHALLEESYDLGETIAEKTEVAIIETVATDRLTDIRKEYETYGLQPPVEGPRPATEESKEGRGIMAGSPMDFDADKFPPQMGAGTPPASSAFFKVRGQPDIKVGNNPYGYA
jgi:hypothetical protein